MRAERWRIIPLRVSMLKPELQAIYDGVPVDLRPKVAPTTKGEIIAAVYAAREQVKDKGWFLGSAPAAFEAATKRAVGRVIAQRQRAGTLCEIPAREVNDFLKTLPERTMT